MSHTSGEVLLITRMRTLNKGNQALSAAWLEMARRAFPDARLRVMERRPRHLLQYTLREVASARDPLRAFDEIADRLAALAPGPSAAGPIGEPRIQLDETIPPAPRFAAARQRLNLRGWLARAGRYRADYRARLAAMQRAAMVIVNPAGEFYPREPLAAFYHLLDARVAQKLGRPTAIVNHTMDITDPTLRVLIPQIYRTLRLVGFRDEKSVESFAAMGGDTSNVVVTPDLALTTARPAAPQRRASTVAIAVNVPEAAAGGYLDHWFDVIAALREQQLAIELVSNEVPGDVPFYERVRARYPDVVIAGKGLGYDRYSELLGTYEYVISSRLHTGVLALVAGTPVIPVEGASFKITALFRDLGIAMPVIRPAPDGRWIELVLAEARRLRSEREADAEQVATSIDRVRERIQTALIPRLRAAAT